VAWIARSDRYSEKLATPDVTMADLIGDIDPIKAARRQLDFADPEVIHFGLVPRANRGIFAVNELPDLAARIQVGLLNVLEEGDVQIRGFPVRLSLDLLLVFSANPEDYTHRGSIITPLRDRIASQILTHYPRSVEEGMAITAQESWTQRGEGAGAVVPDLLRRLVELVAFRARESEFVDQKSGVSARMTIALMENVVSNAERRAALRGERPVVARIADVYGALSAIGGKIELVYEAEREGMQGVAMRLVGEAAKQVFDERFPDVYGKDEPDSPSTVYGTVLRWFRAAGNAEISDRMTAAEVVERLRVVTGLEPLARAFVEVPSGERSEGVLALAMELVLEGLHQASVLSRTQLEDGWGYGDMLAEMARSLEQE
jgi:magnesium chelatase subunit I